MVIKITPDGMPQLGIVETKTATFAGHPPEFSAERLAEKIVGYSEDNEPHVLEQAKAYREQIKQVCLIYIENAIKSYKATLIQELNKGGEEELAKIVLKL